jgi:hypothetical protein
MLPQRFDFHTQAKLDLPQFRLRGIESERLGLASWWEFRRCPRFAGTWRNSVSTVEGLCWPPDRPATQLRSRLLETALAGETLIGSCHRQCVRCLLLEAGHRAFFDRIEGGGREGWRLHFFCLGPSAVHLPHDLAPGDCGPGNPASFDAEKFVVHHLRRLERLGQLSTPDRWCDSVDE